MDVLEDDPLITIGVPTFNRGWSLPRVLDAITGLEYPKKRIRIVFVDNCSTDGTQQILRDFRVRWEGEYEGLLISSVKSNIPEARNICVENAIGNYIFFLDSDVVPPSDGLRRMLKPFSVNRRVAISGLPYPPEGLDGENTSHRNCLERNPHSALIISFGCTLVKGALFKEIGVFNPKWDRGEDYELSGRARHAGYFAVIDPNLEAIHLGRKTAYRRKIASSLFDLKYFVGDLSKQISRSTERERQALRIHSQSLDSANPLPMATRVLFLTTIMALVLWKVALSLTLLIFYCIARAFHLPRKTGAWRTITVFFPLYGLTFVVGVFREIVAGDI